MLKLFAVAGRNEMDDGILGQGGFMGNTEFGILVGVVRGLG